MSKIIIRDENGIEEVLHEPNPIQEKPLKQSIINRIFNHILFPLVKLIVIAITTGVIFGYFWYILNDTTMAIIAFLITVLSGFLYLFNYSSTITFMFIDIKAQSIIIDYEFMNKKKKTREILQFVHIKEIKIKDWKDEYGNILTNLELVKEEENWLGHNKNTQLYVPPLKGVEIAKAIGVDCRHVDTDNKSTMLYVSNWR